MSFTYEVHSATSSAKQVVLRLSPHWWVKPTPVPARVFGPSPTRQSGPCAGCLHCWDAGPASPSNCKASLGRGSRRQRTSPDMLPPSGSLVVSTQ
eukprot:766947-Rhodomonas_salina.1